ncbi:MAG TPA: prolipoprotein diacylglyceryl transferase [Anaerolineales bacterium]|nr:prolipoprotein diacylglyceryl transferase [Anaerolineae bacterium]HRJ56765.1 prolipoprotein diacylglyceryl transferase [Anaerolineales bacterium]HRK90418.1 prolipoprotein diacylglyceryl transferase [Anaerolineales bacterium]
MIDPVIFSFKLFGAQIELTWYGLIVMMGVVIGAWFAEREVRRRGENGEVLVDAMVWAVIGGILGARLWYVGNAIIGGNTSYLEDPLSIIRPPIAGLHFFGGLLFGALVLFIYLKRNGYDVWLFFDAIAPVTLIGQAFGRLGNFINQELYGPPTQLPWGITIPANHRLPEFADLSLYPVETTRFHPTFAYEAILNVLAFLFILWYSRQKEDELKPGVVFSMWLIAAGFIRVFIEFFRPDQPRIGDTFVTTSMIVAFLMGVAGVVIFLVRNGKLQLSFAEGWAEEYKVKQVEKPAPAARTAKIAAASESDDEEMEEPTPKPVRRKTASKTNEKKAAAGKKAMTARKKKAE